MARTRRIVNTTGDNSRKRLLPGYGRTRKISDGVDPILKFHDDHAAGKFRKPRTRKRTHPTQSLGV